MIDSKLTTKIEALLRMAEDDGATEAERELAAKRVAEFATKYQIDLLEIDPHSGQFSKEEITTDFFEVSVKYQLDNERINALAGVVEAFGGKILTRRKAHGWEKPGFTMVATESAIETLKVLLPSLVMQEAAASKKYIAGYKESGEYLLLVQCPWLYETPQLKRKKPVENVGPMIIRRHRQTFMKAWFTEVAKTLRTTRNDTITETSNAYALVLIDNEKRIQDLVDKLKGKSRRGQGTAEDPAAWAAGTAAGKSVDVGHTKFGPSMLSITGA